MEGMSLCDQDLLNVSVRAAMAFGPRCFRCMLEMLSGPVALEFFSDLMVSATSSVVNGGGCTFEFYFPKVFEGASVLLCGWFVANF